MDIQVVNEPFPHLIIDNLYTEEELKLIWRELDFLTHKSKMQSVDSMAPSINAISRLPSATNSGLNLDNVYLGGRYISDILRLNRKVFDREIQETVLKMSPLLSHFKYINHDNTKIRYYDHGEDYKSHWDLARFTFCTYFYKDQSKVKGGELVFPDYDYVIETKNNRSIFFVGGIKHQALPTYREGDYKEFDGFGRYCMNQFLNIIEKDYA